MLVEPADRDSTRAGQGAKFQDTLWSRVFAAREWTAPGSREALAKLCQSYWYPIYAFLRRSGRSEADAHDLTQAFFEFFLRGKLLGKADPQRGRFRSFLLGVLKGFLLNHLSKQRTKRRGGEFQFLSIDAAQAEARYGLEPTTTLTPEMLFDRRWALTVLQHALRRLEEDFTRAEMGEEFALLQPFLTGEADGQFRDLAAQLGRSENALRVQVHRLRRRFRQLVREVIADTVNDSEQVDEELIHLRAALRGETI